MSHLQVKIDLALARKPAMGNDFNHCGWCCLIDVCPVGRFVAKTTIPPCPLLIEREDGWYCSLANTADRKRILGIGTGCCARSIEEQLSELIDDKAS